MIEATDISEGLRDQLARSAEQLRKMTYSDVAKVVFADTYVRIGINDKTGQIFKDGQLVAQFPPGGLRAAMELAGYLSFSSPEADEPAIVTSEPGTVPG